MRPRLAASLVLASAAGLLACPQLLPDDFGPLQNTGDDSCARRQMCAGAGGSSGAGGAAAGAGGTESGSGGSTPNAGSSGAAGAGGSGGSGPAGSGGSAGSGGNGGASGSSGGSDSPDASVGPPDPPACWLVALEDATHDASDNCLGIHGWNDVVDDEEPGTDVDATYQNDQVCFTGTIANSGADPWGAVYNLTFNDPDISDSAGDPWNAAALGVGGFQLEAVGDSLPPSMQVIYVDDDDGDFCRIITPGPAVQVPFASAHPDCSTSSSSVPDADDLTHLRLAMPPAASTYAIDFCLGIRAIP